MSKEIIIGYVDLTDRELRKTDMIDMINDDGLLFKTSSKSKSFVKEFINKTNKAKLYKVVFKEIK